jgi:hypothetical protein
MKRTVCLLPILLAFFPAYASPPDPAQALFKSAVRHEKQGKLEVARLNLLWLANFYAESPLATRARDEMGAIHLFEDGQAHIRDGRYGPATVTFRTVAQVYPESPLAKQAEAASRIAERQEERTGGPIVRSIAFQHMAPATAHQILDRFAEREVGLAVEQTYRPEDLGPARHAIAGLLAEKGIHNVDVRAEVHALSNNRVRIVFMAVNR